MGLTLYLIMLMCALEYHGSVSPKVGLFANANGNSLSYQGKNKIRQTAPRKSVGLQSKAYSLRLLLIPKKTLLKPNSLVTLNCKLKGKVRAATFWWEKDGVALAASSRRFIKTRIRSERLRIKRTRAIDSGRYRCFAKVNGRRFYSRAVKVLVTDTNDGQNGFQLPSSPIFQKRCEYYRGTMCVDNLNSDRTVFMRPGEDQDEIEERLAKNFNKFGNLLSPACYPDALRLACINLFPPCRDVNDTAVPLKMCRDSCNRLPDSHCAKGFELLLRLKIIQAVDNCSLLPETDSNEPCARVFFPGNNFKNIECKRSFRLKDPRFSIFENHLEYTSDPLPHCENVHWKTFNKKARMLLGMVLPSAVFPGNGRFSRSLSNLFCFRVPLKLSMLFGSKAEYSRVVNLPELNEIGYERKIDGFSVKLGADGKIKQMIIPIGYLREYGIDRMVTIPNVTIYLRKERQVSTFYGEGMFDLCGTAFNIRIEQTNRAETLLIGRSIHPVDLSTIELAFGLRQATPDLRQVMEKFRILELRLMNPKLNIIWRENERRAMRFSGQVVDSGWGSEKVNFELLLGRDQSFWATAITTTKQSFVETFDGIFNDRKHVRLARLLDVALDVYKVGFVLATKDVEVQKHPSLRFQHEPVKTMTQTSIPNGLTLEARANVKENCKRNDNRLFLCQLVQLAAGLKASTFVRIKSDLKGTYLVLEFHPDGLVPAFTSKVLSKLRRTWEKINPFSRVPASNVEIVENTDQNWRSLPRFGGIIWLRKLEINVGFMESMDVFERKIVYMSADVVYMNKRYIYKINKVGLSYCMRMLDDITKILKRFKNSG